MFHNSMLLISSSILGASHELNHGSCLCFTRAKLAHVIGSGQATQAIKSSYLALSTVQTGSLGPSPAQNAEDSQEDSYREEWFTEFISEECWVVLGGLTMTAKWGSYFRIMDIGISVPALVGSLSWWVTTPFLLFFFPLEMILTWVSVPESLE